MKSPYIWIVVFFRVVAVCVALWGGLSTISGLVLMSSGGSGLSLPAMLLRVLVVQWVFALVLWFFSRPIARLIVGDLDEQ